MLICPNNCLMHKFNFICLANLLSEFSKFLPDRRLCEYPNELNFCTLLNVLILTPYTQLQPYPIIYVSTGANLCFWQYFQVVKKCILYCFKNPDKLPDHSYAHKTSLHPIWHHFIDPFDHHNYFKFLAEMMFVKQVLFWYVHLA